MQFLKKNIIYILIFIILINLGLLNYWHYQQNPVNPSPSPDLITTLTKPIQGFPLKTVVDENGQEVQLLDADLIQEQIKQSTSALTFKVGELSDKFDQFTGKTSITSPTSQIVTLPVKEYYIPLGSGSTTSTTWIDLTGVEAYLAPSNYGQITELYFEASLRNPTGNGRAFARLNNVTDKNTLFESEVSFEGSGAKMISSGKIPVPTTTKLYRAQLKSSLGSEIFLDSGRLKIFVK